MFNIFSIPKKPIRTGADAVLMLSMVHSASTANPNHNGHNTRNSLAQRGKQEVPVIPAIEQGIVEERIGFYENLKDKSSQEEGLKLGQKNAQLNSYGDAECQEIIQSAINLNWTSEQILERVPEECIHTTSISTSVPSSTPDGTTPITSTTTTTSTSVPSSTPDGTTPITSTTTETTSTPITSTTTSGTTIASTTSTSTTTTPPSTTPTSTTISTTTTATTPTTPTTTSTTTSTTTTPTTTSTSTSTTTTTPVSPTTFYSATSASTTTSTRTTSTSTTTSTISSTKTTSTSTTTTSFSVTGATTTITTSTTTPTGVTTTQEISGDLPSLIQFLENPSNIAFKEKMIELLELHNQVNCDKSEKNYIGDEECIKLLADEMKEAHIAYNEAVRSNPSASDRHEIDELIKTNFQGDLESDSFTAAINRLSTKNDCLVSSYDNLNFEDVMKKCLLEDLEIPGTTAKGTEPVAGTPAPIEQVPKEGAKGMNAGFGAGVGVGGTTVLGIAGFVVKSIYNSYSNKLPFVITKGDNQIVKFNKEEKNDLHLFINSLKNDNNKSLCNKLKDMKPLKKDTSSQESQEEFKIHYFNKEQKYRAVDITNFKEDDLDFTLVSKNKRRELKSVIKTVESLRPQQTQAELTIQVSPSSGAAGRAGAAGGVADAAGRAGAAGGAAEVLELALEALRNSDEAKLESKRELEALQKSDEAKLESRRGKAIATNEAGKMQPPSSVALTAVPEHIIEEAVRTEAEAEAAAGTRRRSSSSDQEQEGGAGADGGSLPNSSSRRPSADQLQSETELMIQ